LTLIVPRRAGRGTSAAGGQASIGLRMPAHPVAQALLRSAARAGVAGVAAPSANRFGRVSPTTAAHVEQEFGAALLVLDGGPCAVGIESAIVDCTRQRPTLLRPGQISRTELEAVLGESLHAPDNQSPRAPGTLASHYAPRAALSLLEGADLHHRLQAARDRGLPKVGVYSRGDAAVDAHAGWIYRTMPEDAAAVAHELYTVLREFDDAGVAAIWVERPPLGPAWEGVRDRLQRAAN
jgi:L-threonylcarbamoyladenylate synthase